MKIKVYSEIGKLKKVLVHRPGKEVERIYPEIFERLLFDDIMYLKIAQEEHDYFVEQLKNEGVEVYYIEKLVAEAIDKQPTLKAKFIEDYLKLSGIADNKAVYDAAKKFFMSFKDNKEMVDATIAGLKKSEVKPKFTASLTDKVLKEEEYPFYIDPIPNILFQRDPIASVFDGMNLHNMYSVTRRREKLYYDYGFKKHPKFKSIKYHITPEDGGTMEGGDVLVINKETIFVGISQRTTASTVELYAKKMLAKYKHLKRVVGIQIPDSHATMHLDTVLTQMDKNIFSVDADMAKEKYTVHELTRGTKGNLTVKSKVENIKKVLTNYVAKNIKLVIVGGGETVRAKREQWNDGANCLCLEPGKIVVYNRNVYTNKLLRKAGINTIEIKSSELSSGRGGPRCMSMPLEREDVK